MCPRLALVAYPILHHARRRTISRVETSTARSYFMSCNSRMEREGARVEAAPAPARCATRSMTRRCAASRSTCRTACCSAAGTARRYRDVVAYHRSVHREVIAIVARAARVAYFADPAIANDVAERPVGPSRPAPRTAPRAAAGLVSTPVSETAFDIDFQTSASRGHFRRHVLRIGALHAQRERVFARTWPYAAHDDVVKVAGQVHPFTLLPGVLDEPLLLTRDAQDEMHARSRTCARIAGHSWSRVRGTSGRCTAVLATASLRRPSPLDARAPRTFHRLPNGDRASRSEHGNTF